MDEELIHLGLDIPFTTKLVKSLRDNGYDIPKDIFNEDKLVDYLWKLKFKTFRIYISNKIHRLKNMPLYDININIPHHSYTAVIGHTGSGKSTLLQHLNGLFSQLVAKFKLVIA